MKKLIINCGLLLFTILLATNCSPEQKGDRGGAEGTNQQSAVKGAKRPKQLTIGFVSPLISHPAWMVVKRGAEDAGKQFGFDVLWVGAEDHTLSRMLEATETLIAQRVDGIAVYALSAPAFTPVLKRSKAAGIPVATYACDAERPDLRVGFAGSDMVKIGHVQIREAHRKLGKDGMIIAILMSNLDAGNQIIQVGEFEKYVKNLKGARIADKRENAGGGDDAKTLDVVSSMLKANPEINVILETDGGGPSVVGKVLAEMNLTEKVVAIGMDDLPQSLDAVRQGKIHGLMVQNFYKWGYVPARNAYLGALGKKVEDFTDTGFVFVTKENVDTYKDDFYK